MSNVNGNGQQNFANKHKKIAGIHDRVDELSKVLQEFGSGVERAVRTLQQQVSNMTEILDAVVGSIGDAEVTRIVLANRKERMLADEQKRRESIIAGIEKGTIKPIDKIVAPAEGEDPNKYLIALEELRNNPEGTEPPREKIEGSFVVTNLASAQLKEHMDKLVGKGVGVEFEAGKLQDGAISTAVVVGIYERVPAPLVAVPPPPADAPSPVQSESSPAV